jgi:hypothetical protein
MKVRKVSPYGLFLLLALTMCLFAVGAIAQQQGFYQVSQGETRVQVTPLESPSSAAEFYNFSASVANTGLEEANGAVMFLYRDTTSGQVSLFVLLSGPGGSAGTTSITISGVPAGASYLVQDDTFDFRDTWDMSPPSASASLSWNESFSDGFVLGPLGEDSEVTLFPQFSSGIQTAKFLYGSRTAPSTMFLNLIDPVIISAATNMPPTAALSATPLEPRVDESVTFDASGSFDGDGTIVTYEWDFNGDGLYDQSTTTPITSFAYTTPGLKTAAVRVTDADGASARATFAVFIEELAVTVTRTISTMTALPGSTFLVVVRIEPEMDLVGVGLEEELPVGWQVTPLENAGAAFKRADVQWVFIDKIRAGTTKVITYEVTVPPAEQLIATTLPVCFDITGIFQARSPGFEMPVEGDNTVEVNDTLSIFTAIAHLVPRTSIDLDDRIDLRLSQKIAPEQLQRAIEMWQYSEPVPWTQGATIDLFTMKRLSAYSYTCTPVDLPLPLVPETTIHAVRTIATPVPCNNILLNYYGKDGRPSGNTFTVKVEIWADQDLYGVGLAEDLPTGWRVIPIQNDGFYYKRSTTEWVYPSKLPAGECKIIIYQVEVPQTAPIEMPSGDPCYASSNDLYGLVDSALPCQDVAVTGDSAVDISDCLTVIVAISRWDVEHDTIDITLSDRISFQQVQRAIAFWLEDEVVPRTCGGVVDYETLKTIVAYWLTGTNICEPLPTSAIEECDIQPEPCAPSAPECGG